MPVASPARPFAGLDDVGASPLRVWTWRVVRAPERGAGAGMGDRMPRVLMVEDESEIAEMYRLGLTASGIAVEVVSKASDVVDRLSQEFFDLILLDIRLKGVSGLEFLAQFKDHPSLVATRVAILSNYSAPSTIDEARRLGAVEYFVKSRLTPADLAWRIREILSAS